MRLESLPDGKWALYSPYSQTLVDACHQVPGLVWNKSLRAWVGYIDAWAECDYLAVKELIGQVPKEVLQASPTRYNSKLREYQVEGASFIEQFGAGGCLLADGMGFRKNSASYFSYLEQR